MNNPIFNAARIYLSKKYSIINPTELYKHLIQNPILCHADTLKKESWDDLLYKFVFLGGFHERRNCGSQAKDLTFKCLLQIRERMVDLDVPTLIQIFLAMSNVLIYDEKIVNEILAQLNNKASQLQVKQFQSISHCLYKLGQKNEYWQKIACQQMIDNIYNVGIQDYVQYMHIASNLYQMNQFQEDNLLKLFDIMQYKLEKQQKHIFLSKFSYQFIQLIFNIYPEIIKSPVNQCQIQSKNKFEQYFNSLKRDYIICRQILDRKLHGLTIDYFENENFPNLIRIKEDTIQRQQTQFEKYIEELLKTLQLDYKQQFRLAIYDTDFVVQNKVILNCNGPSHFIQDLSGNILAKSPNFLMQKRHLRELGTYSVVDLDFHIWDKYDTTEKQLAELKKLLNFI